MEDVAVPALPLQGLNHRWCCQHVGKKGGGLFRNLSDKD